jgi:YspA, cpYpsA-related SLOG family
MNVLAPRLVFSGTHYGVSEAWRIKVWREADLWVEEFGPPRMVFEGGAPGVDHHAKMWARARGHDVQTFDADWETFGNAAGMYRNEFMCLAADPGDHGLALPHPDRPSPGTRNCIGHMRRCGLIVRIR